MKITAEINKIHEVAMVCSQRYKRAESDLLDAIVSVKEHKAFRYYACASVYEYCVKILKLDPGVVYNFTAVAKKIKEVPELRGKIVAREINVSTARRITSVLNNENKDEWFSKAQTLSVRRLEKEVARVNPREEVRERASYLSSRRVRLEMGLDEELMLKIRRIQDLESQKQRRSVSLEETLRAMADDYAAKNDPIEKAKRATIRGVRGKVEPKVTRESNTKPESNPESKPTAESKTAHQGEKSATWQKSKPAVAINRQPIPAQVLHQVNLRDQTQCQHLKNENTKCKASRFIEIHHINPVSKGGSNELENLVTLCAEHHRQKHEFK